jgi:hypothetical protein
MHIVLDTEPRIGLQEVRVESGDDPALALTHIAYTHVRDGRPGNLVYRTFTPSGTAMPLPRPILDDRSYEQLRDERIRRIPVDNREWTDHDPRNPGITLVELFVFLGEELLY